MNYYSFSLARMMNYMDIYNLIMGFKMKKADNCQLFVSAPGLEPGTLSLKGRCSTTELCTQHLIFSKK